mgnify:CR=1 FL=1
MLEKINEEAKWYVVYTYPGYENKVASNLQKTVENRHLENLILEIHVPTETVVEVKDNKKREVERKTFPGYVLIRMVLTDETWYIVRNTRGCRGFVGGESPTKPSSISDEEVAALLGTNRKNIEVNYSEGNSVRIVSGSFEDFVGTVDRIDKVKNIVNVTVSMFGRDTPVELELSQVEPI